MFRLRQKNNLTIYERQRAAALPEDEYKRFLSNEEQLAESFGRNLQFFRKNKAEVDLQNVAHRLIKQQETLIENQGDWKTMYVIQNPYGLKIRPEKQIAEVLGLSRSQVKRLVEQGEIQVEMLSVFCVRVLTNASLLG